MSCLEAAVDPSGFDIWLRFPLQTPVFVSRRSAAPAANAAAAANAPENRSAACFQPGQRQHFNGCFFTKFKL